MTAEKFPMGVFGGDAERADTVAQRFETADAVGARLIEQGWSEEQLGRFVSTMRMMADAVIAHGNEAASAAGEINFELTVTKDEDGGEVAEVTIAGEGNGFGPEQIAQLIDRGELPVEAFDRDTTQFFEDQNKVVLRRKKDIVSETDTIQNQ